MRVATGFAFAIKKEINAKDAKDAKDAIKFSILGKEIFASLASLALFFPSINQAAN